MKVFQISDAHRMYSVNPQKSQQTNKQTNTSVLFSKTSSSIGLQLNWTGVYHVFVNSKTGCSGRLQMVAATMTGSGFYHISVVLWTAHWRGSGLTERQHCSNRQIKKGWHHITIQQDHQNDMMTLNVAVLHRLCTAASDGEGVFSSKVRQPCIRIMKSQTHMWWRLLS